MQVDWENWQPSIRATLLFVVQEGRVLLIRKKRGLGAGKINGPGGKIDPGETPLESALREVEEELRIRVRRESCQETGVLRFQFLDGLAIHCTVFRAGDYDGEPSETAEAIPLWFDFDAIPFDEMWADDRLWLAETLKGRRFRGDFIFDGDTMLDHHVEWLE